MTREALIDLIRHADPLAAARVAPAPAGTVRVVRGDPPADWLVDVDTEGSIAAHRDAHAHGRPSEALVRYGAGTTPEQVADRLLALAELAGDTGLLRVVRPEPGDDSTTRPGSWGVEDLTVMAAARAVLPPGVEVQPSWHHLGPEACQVAVAFGATQWRIPADDPTDPGLLAGPLRVTVQEAT